MINKIDHIGVAVENISDAKKMYEDILGLKVTDIEEVVDQKVKVAFIPIGESEFELLESTDPEGPITKYIAKKGQGIQHIALQVDNIENALQDFKNKGVKLIDEKPRYGAGGAKIAFLHPKSTNGILIEICERS